MVWFEELFGFAESEQAVLRHVSVDGALLRSSANGRSFACGTLTVPTLDELREEAAQVATDVAGELRVREVVGDARELHADPANAGALFQVASQFNLLEMVAPEVTPAAGITIYEHDNTQGPACAMACAAGTLQRNWFAQSSEQQIDTLGLVGADLGNALHDGRGRFWDMVNGYALLTGEFPEVPETHGQLQIGLQTDTEVTLAGAGHLVSQAYCSALPLGYVAVSADEAEPLARMVLNSSYEATLAAGVRNAARTGNTTVWLTLVGGGVFDNRIDWIVDAIDRAVEHYGDVGLDVAIVSHRSPNPALRRLLD